MPKFPVKVYHPREGREPKVLIAKDAKELAGLVRVGWKVEDASS